VPLRHERALGVLLALACGAQDPRSPPPAAERKPVEAPASSREAEPDATPIADTLATTPSEVPPEPPTLATLLPPASRPITLQHARELAKAGSWLAAAAVYGAMFEADPKDVRALSGRGFALASSGDPRADALARADYVRALELPATPAAKAMVHFNLASLEERLGNRDAAREQFGKAYALKPTESARHGIERMGGTPPAKPGAPRCEVTTPAQAERATSTLDVLRRIRKAQRDTHELPADDNAASKELCGGACENAFLSTLGDHGGTIEGHVVVHERGGFWVIPQLVSGNGPDARCPDEIVDIAVTHEGPLVRASFSLLVNFWDDCDMQDPDCLNGCFWETRVDHVVLVDEAKGRWMMVTGTAPENDVGGDGPWQRLEETKVLPPGMITTEGTSVKIRGCGLDEDVTL
jgi:hypothetical protein